MKLMSKCELWKLSRFFETCLIWDSWANGQYRNI